MLGLLRKKRDEFNGLLAGKITVSMQVSEEIQGRMQKIQKLRGTESKSATLLRTPGGGDSNIKKVGVLVVSLRGVNFRFWSRLGC